MSYSNILSFLYGENIDLLCHELNRAVYATDYKETEDTIVISTGFCCKIQTGKIMEFLYDLTTGTLIYQPRPIDPHLPLINGLVYKRNKVECKGYYYQCIRLIFTGVEADNDAKTPHAEPSHIYIADPGLSLCSVDIQKDGVKSTYDRFIVFELSNSQLKVLKSYPIQKCFGVLFKGYNGFQKYDPDYNSFDSNDYMSDNDYQSKEDWLNSEFGDEAEWAAWNID